MSHPFHPSMRHSTLAMPEVETLAPWSRVFAGGIGGLYAVGFAPGTTLLLAISSQGRGVFDGLTGECVARDDDDEAATYDPIRLLGVGIGPIAGVKVPVCGDHGGGMPAYTRDMWQVHARCLEWPDQIVLLSHWTGDAPLHARIDAGASIRAMGFSQCGRSLVVAADYGELKIFSRPAEVVGPAQHGWDEIR